MKKTALLLSAICLIVNVCFAQDFKITAKISKMKPQKATLAYYFEDKQYVAIDSGKIENGSIVFEKQKHRNNFRCRSLFSYLICRIQYEN